MSAGCSGSPWPSQGPDASTRPLVDPGALRPTPATGEDLAVAFYGPIHLFAQRWLFRGPLSEAGKEAFRQAAYRHVQRFFQERGTDAWQPS